ncbi:hypothetical protein LJC39_01880 [Parabacteroides sp. OttesenSCG-928-B22]|nr:hypothetical protein [Parabacteroides sp. OttesenSCG-928-B22]
MYTYIHNSIRNYVELDNELDVESNVIAEDWNGYLLGGWLLLSEEQLAFREANPTASKQEVYNMQLNPVIVPEQPEPTQQEKLLSLMLEIAPTAINTIDMDNNTALYYKEFHPHWSVFIDGKLSAKDRVQHNDRLFRVQQDIPVVLATQEPGAEGMGALYTEINEENAGTKEDPIPFDPVAGMELKSGLFYSQLDVIYECIRDSGTPLYHNLADLVGSYVKVAE